MEASRQALRGIYAPPRAKKPWRLDELLAPTRLRYFSYGRAALSRALGLCGAKQGDLILLPGLICREVLPALEPFGAWPLYYAVDESLNPAADTSRLPPARAVVAVNYFGFPQDLSYWRAYCARTGAALIEDNAHGLFSLGPDGSWLGTRADFGIFSLRKTMALPDGAALAMPESGRFPLPAQETFVRRAHPRQLAKRLLSLTVPVLGTGVVRGLHRLWRGHGNAGDAASTYPVHPAALDPRPGRELAQPLVLADPEAEIARRRALYSLADGLVRPAGGVPIFPRLPDGVCPYGFPYYADEATAPEIETALDQEGLESFPWPDLPDAAANQTPPHYRRIRCVRFLW